MRTPALFQLDRTISRLNTFFVTSDFFATEFWRANGDKVKTDPTRFTTELFPENEAAKRINVRMSVLQSHSADFSQFLIQQVVSRCNEASKDYFEWLEHFSFEIYGTTFSDEPSYYEGIAAQTGALLASLIDPECVETLDHLRIRRNCLVHRDGDANEAYRRISSQKGDRLNKYWQQSLGPGRELNFDFGNKDPGSISALAVIDLLCLTRICIETFDKNYCQKLPGHRLQEYIERAF